MNEDIQGNLETTRCSEIVKILSLGKRAGRLFLSSGTETGSIYFNDGRLVHAKSGQLEGVKAIFEMAAWTTGSYKFFIDESTDLKTINQSLEEILKETENRIRQMEKIASLIPSANAIFSLDTDIKEKEIILKAIQWKILSLINGERSISQIANVLGITDSDAMKVFYTLLRQGLIRESKKKDSSLTGHKSAFPETPYVSALIKNLTMAIGPVAPYIILETVSETGLDLLNDDISQRAVLIETLHSKIPDEKLALNFLNMMNGWLKTGDSES
jgi:hypothetical protein